MPYCHKSRILEHLLRRAHKMRDDRKHIQEHTEKNCTDHPQADPDHSEEHGILRINNIKIHSNECDNQKVQYPHNGALFEILPESLPKVPPDIRIFSPKYLQRNIVKRTQRCADRNHGNAAQYKYQIQHYQIKDLGDKLHNWIIYIK